MTLELALNNFLKDEMISFIESHPNEFEKLIELALTDNQPESSRAAWLLSYFVEKNDSRITNHIPQFINALSIVQDGQQRELVYILRQMDLSEEQEGLLFDICIEIWSKQKNMPSVRYNALIYIIEIVKKYPELINEVILLTQDFYLESLSKGIKRAAQQLIDNFKKEYISD